jgi:hypothetical protein
MKKTILMLLVTAVSTGAMAGPLEGELFGYRLGDKYPVGPQTKFEAGDLIAAKLIVAENSEKPEGIGSVKLMVTPKTFTIFYIYADSEFPDEKTAKAFADDYAQLLSTKYGSKCVQRKTDPEWGPLALVCSKQYELSVRYFIAPERSPERIGVRIELSADGGSVSQSLSGKLVAEDLELKTKAKKQGLEKAQKEQRLKGL